MTPFQNSAPGFPAEAGAARREADHLLGDFAALMQQIGVHGISPAFDAPPPEAPKHIAELPALQTFLDTYCADVLLPVELPAIVEACGFARRGETRELIALDQRLAGETRMAAFALASRKTGAMQLRRMKPLRDERTVQRYLAAVDAGQAAGWHTLVYGLTLAIFSFPLRQGLLHYARETVSGLALAAAGAKNYFDPACQDMLQGLLARLPEAVEKNVAGQMPGGEARMTIQ